MAEKIQQAKSKLLLELNQGQAVSPPGAGKHHRAVARRTRQTLLESPLLMMMTAPVIYLLTVPLSLSDLFVSTSRHI